MVENKKSRAADPSGLDDVERKQRRNRMGNGASFKSENQRKPTFGVKLWRLDEFDLETSTRSQNVGGADGDKMKTEGRNTLVFLTHMYKNTLSTEDVDVYSQQLNIHQQLACFSFSGSPLADHLLHLVNYNAFRGFFCNKATLSQLTDHLVVTRSGTEKLNIMAGLKRVAVVIAASPHIPLDLQPTALQSRQAHATWIDLLPCPRMRDNLITHHDEFNHWSLVNDVMGNLLDDIMFNKYGEGTGPKRQYGPAGHKFDGPASHRRGIIIWGEPHQMMSWEITPGFLDRWGWVVEGCDGLMKATNHWRSLRGERPLKFSLQDKQQSKGY
ncbi:hypothetical protein HG530_012247 [Fusarium avenaceum]|nr:hypothetical protein HG530_012247 [Fusarium avenaceum]